MIRQFPTFPPYLMTWIAALHNPQALQSVFSDLTTLDEVSLFEVVLSRDGPRLSLRVELARFPDRPPKRWSPHSNRVQASIVLHGVRAVEVSGFGRLNVGILTIAAREDGAITVAVRGDTLRISAVCDHASLESLSDYTSDVAEGWA